MQKPRADLYGPVHQGVRRLLYETALELGTTDFRSDEETDRALLHLEQALSLLVEHAEAEETYFHPALDARQPGACAAQESQHAEHGHNHAVLESIAAQMRGAAPMERVGLGARLYSVFNTYLAEQVQHMAGEEAVLRPLFWQHFSDDELEALRGEVMSKFTPERRAEWFRWMLPSLSQVQLVGMLGGMRQAMPAPVFEGLCKGVAPVVGERWEAIAAELGL